MAVTVRSNTASSEPSRRPSRMVRVISRLRRLASSISRAVALRYDCKRSTCAERGSLRLVEIIDHGAGGTQGLVVARIVAEAKAFQVIGMKLLEQVLPGGFQREGPAGPPRDEHLLVQMPRQRRRVFGQQAFGGRDPRQLIGQLGRGKMGRHETARRDLHPGQPDRIARRNGGQVVALAGIEQGVIGDRAGRDDPRHFALYQSLGQLGVFDLFADGSPQAGGDQFAQVAFQLVVGEAGHRHTVLALVARGEGQIEHAGGGLRVVVEHLIEVAHAEQQQGVGACPFGLFVLSHHGGGCHAYYRTGVRRVGERRGR